MNSTSQEGQCWDVSLNSTSQEGQRWDMSLVFPTIQALLLLHPVIPSPGGRSAHILAAPVLSF